MGKNDYLTARLSCSCSAHTTADPTQQNNNEAKALPFLSFRSVSQSLSSSSVSRDAMAPVSTRMTVQQHTTTTTRTIKAGGHLRNASAARWTSKANSVRGPQRLQAFRKNNPAN